MPVLFSVLLANALCTGAIMVIIPVIGPIIRELGLAEWHGGVVVASAGLLWMLSARWWGNLSDRVGRKRVLVIGMACFSVAYLAMSGFVDYALQTAMNATLALVLLILTRGLIGIFFAAIPTTVAAKVADITPIEKRGANMAKVGATNGIGMVFGPTLGGLLAAKGLVLPLYCAAVVPLLACILLAIALHSDKPHAHEPKPMLKISDERLRLPVFAALLSMFAIITAQMSVGFFIIDRLGFGPEQAATLSGYAMGVVGVTLIVVQVLASRFHQIKGEHWIIAGALVSSAGFVYASLASNPTSLLIAYAIMPAGLGLVMPAFQGMASSAVAADEQGAAAGTLSAAQALASVVTPLVAMVLYEISPSLGYQVAAASLLVLGFVFVLDVKKDSAV